MNSSTMKENLDALRNKMIDMLSECTSGQQDMFRRMYDHKGTHAHPVYAIPQDRLDNAFSQIERTLVKNAKADNPTKDTP